MNNTGFVAGTLVHTDKGLVPIQELKVGDRVLSKSETGKGALEYKAVVRTIKSATKQKIMTPVDGIYCTENHPFWTHVSGEDKPRWLAAKFISRNDTVHQIFPARGPGGGVYDINGRYHEDAHDPYHLGGNYVIATSDPKVALYMGSLFDKHEGPGEIDIGVVDFSNGEALEVFTDDEDSILGKESYMKAGYNPNWEPYKFLDKANPGHRIEIEYYSKLIEAYRVPDWDQDVYAKSTCHTDYVYNIEVADTHTYFIGPLGIWVHDLTEQANP